ncbi:hypothetical protein MRX96_013583 [Rhipicephalus microplus]
MPPRTFDTLLHLVKHHIEKKNTNFRKAISPEHRLAQTLSVPGALGCTWSYIRCPSIKCRRVATGVAPDEDAGCSRGPSKMTVT